MIWEKISTGFVALVTGVEAPVVAVFEEAALEVND